MKFLADMGISSRTVAFLRQHQYESVHLSELALERLPDADILVKARQEGYVLLTYDLDFGELMASSGALLPSVIIFRLKDMRPDNVNRYLLALLNRHFSALQHGAILSVTQNKVRVRTLPIIRN